MEGPGKASSPQHVEQVRENARSYIAQLRQARLARLRGGPVSTSASGDAVGALKPQTRGPGASSGVAAGKRGKRVSIAAPEGVSGAGEQEALQQDALADLARLSGKRVETQKPKAPPKAPTKKSKGGQPKPKVKAAEAAPKAKPAPKPKAAPAQAEPLQNKPRPSSSQLTTRAERQAHRLSHRQAAREGVAKARAAAHSAQQKMREARLTQRAAAAKQRENASIRHNQSGAAQPAIGQPTVQARRRPAPGKGSSLRAPRTAASISPPLTALRGIGDAMSRRLDKAGIATLEDLLATDVTELRGRLGPISALANIEGWQEQAAQLCQTRKTR